MRMQCLPKAGQRRLPSIAARHVVQLQCPAGWHASSTARLAKGMICVEPAWRGPRIWRVGWLWGILRMHMLTTINV
jgi:hypothetical protein